MFWDYNFWENIVISYISSVATGITLLIFGTTGYVLNKKYSIVQKISQKFSVKSGGTNIGNVQGNVNVIFSNQTLPGPTGSTKVLLNEEINNKK